jgi:7-keto-8-aminopelargonate synthetase-like enzyme
MMLGPVLKFVDRDYVLFEGRKLLYLGGIDYHRMSNDPMILKAVAEATFEYGLNPTGSRTTTGNHPLYLELERKVAEFFESEDSAVFPSGYLGNIILLQAIANEYDIFLLDRISHSSIADAARQFGKQIILFEHLDAQDLDQKLKEHMKAPLRPLILTDGVFPARGEIPPLNQYIEVVKKYDGKILVDDAHAMAVVGKTGKGSWEAKGIHRDLIYQTGTLSKGFGVFGGIIPGKRQLISQIQNKSLAFVGATGLPLPLAAGAIKSIDYMISHRQIIIELQKRALELKDQFRQLGFDLPPSPAPIFSITFYDEEKNKRLYNILIRNGIYPPFINYPGAPQGGHFRFIITSITTSEQVKLLFETVKSSL